MSLTFRSWYRDSVALQKDSKLRDARESLVPKEIDEDGFWRNYFFRVNLLKRAFNLPEYPQCKEGAPTTKPTHLRAMLSAAGSSLGQPEPLDFSDATPLSSPPSEDEPNINGLIDTSQTVTSDNDAVSLREDSAPFNSNDAQQTPNDSTRRDSFDPEDTSTSHQISPMSRRSGTNRSYHFSILGSWQMNYDFDHMSRTRLLFHSYSEFATQIVHHTDPTTLFLGPQKSERKHPCQMRF